jgi:hypothetical protein
MAALVDTFLRDLESDDSKLTKQLYKIRDEAEDTLVELLGRFNDSGGDSLSAGERALVAKVLNLLHRPSPRGLELLSSILGYLDVNANGTLEHTEAVLAVEVLELFCKADSANDTLSNKELEILQAVLMHIDTDGNGVIDPSERTALRDELWEPEEFLANQRRDNPLVQELFGD